MSGRTQADLAALLGSRSRASEILNRKRALTMDMAQKLNREWGIPAEVLVQPYRLDAASLYSAGRAPPLPPVPAGGVVAMSRRSRKAWKFSGRPRAGGEE